MLCSKMLNTYRVCQFNWDKNNCLKLSKAAEKNSRQNPVRVANDSFCTLSKFSKKEKKPKQLSSDSIISSCHNSF